MAELNDKLITYGNLSTFYDKLQEQGLGGNAIEDASVLPEASENKNKLFRLESDDNVYVSELKSSSTLTNRLPDAQQINTAYLYEDSETFYYYKGAFKLICTDGEIDGYAWQGEDTDYVIFTLDNTINISTSSLYYMPEESEGWVFSGSTATSSSFNIEYVEEYYEELSGWGIMAAIPAIYNEPEVNQVDNAYLVDSNNIETGLYTGEQITFEDTDGSGEQITGYKWTDLDDSETYCFATDKPASEIYYSKNFNGEEYIYDTDARVWRVNLSNYTSEQTSFNINNGLYVPQLNATETEQINNAYIVANNSNYIYTGFFKDILLDGSEIRGYKWYYSGTSTYIYSTKIASQIYNTDKDSSNVHFYLVDEHGNVTSELSFSGNTISEIHTVKYQRSVGEEWLWEKVATQEYVNSNTNYTAGNYINISNKVITCTYQLPIAAETTLGGVIVNKWGGLNINNGVLSITENLAELIKHPELIEYLTFEALHNNTNIYVRCFNSDNTHNIMKVSKNKINWNTYYANKNNDVLIATLNQGEKIYLKSSDFYGFFIFNDDCYVYGNAMTVDGFLDSRVDTFTCSFLGLAGLFTGNTHILNHPTKKLMLPATTLANYCYTNMFAGCSSLTTAPELPATKLANSCYNGMFQNCTSLNYIKCLAIDTSANDCLKDWTTNILSSNGAFVKNPEMTGWTVGNSGIPSGWTVENYTESVVVEPIIIDESTFTGATLTVDGSQPSIVASGSTTIVWDDLAASIPSGKSVEVSVVLINTGNSALTPTMQGNYQMMGDGNLTIQASELGLYRGRYISALNKWLIEAIHQEVSGIME